MNTPTIPDGYIAWEDLQAKVAANRTPEQQQAYEDSATEAEAQIALANSYVATFDEWAASGEAALWETTTADGLNNPDAQDVA